MVLAPMAEYAQCFRENFDPDCCERGIPSGYGIERMNILIFGLKNTTVIPYVLFVAKEVQDQEKRGEIYALLESYLMRRIVVRASTKNYNNLFSSLILNNALDAQSLKERLSKKGDATTYIPDDDELWRGFRESKLVNMHSRGILYMLEAAMRPANAATMLLGFNGYSLEHLMPKNWTRSWGVCATEEMEKRRNSLLLTLGNLAIIPQSLNASIRDSDWETKKAGKGSARPGLDMCAGGLLTLQDALKKAEWNEAEIESRADWLFERAQVIWAI